MTLKFLCPSGHRLKADPCDSGLHVACPTCGHKVIIPRPDDLDGSDLQEENSETFAGISVDGGDAIVSARPPAPPLLEPRALKPRPRPLPRLVHAYRPDERRFESAKWLTCVLGLMVAFSVAPVVPRLNLLASSGWPRVVLIVAVLQASYLAWMLSAPDWSMARAVMIVFGVTTVIYAAAIAWIAVTPAEEPLGFGLDQVRPRALQWSGCVLTLMLFGAYLCARASSDWRGALQREMVGRANPKNPNPDEPEP